MCSHAPVNMTSKMGGWTDGPVDSDKENNYVRISTMGYSWLSESSAFSESMPTFVIRFNIRIRQRQYYLVSTCQNLEGVKMSCQNPQGCPLPPSTLQGVILTGV